MSATEAVQQGLAVAMLTPVAPRPAQIATLILLLLHDTPFKRTFTGFLLNRYSRLLRLSEELPSIANFLDRITVHVFNKQVSVYPMDGRPC